MLKNINTRFIALCLVFASAAVVAQSRNNSASAREPAVREAFRKVLPAMGRNNLRLTLVAVNYPPAGASAPHTHPCPVVGYVTLGAVRIQVRGEAIRIYKTGETFYEPPNAVHEVSENASTSSPAAFVAYFLCGTDAPLSSPTHIRNKK